MWFEVIRIVVTRALVFVVNEFSRIRKISSVKQHLSVFCDVAAGLSEWMVPIENFYISASPATTTALPPGILCASLIDHAQLMTDDIAHRVAGKSVQRSTCVLSYWRWLAATALTQTGRVEYFVFRREHGSRTASSHTKIVLVPSVIEA